MAFPSTARSNGIVYLVGAGPGDPGLITLRGLEVLQQAEVVVYDRLVNRSLLALASPEAEWINVGKRPDHHPIPQSEINALLIQYAAAGKRVVRLKGGDPFVFGRGGEEAQALVTAGYRFEIIPGVTSAIAGPAYAGIPVTHRDMACSAALVTGHRADCDAEDWRRMAQAADTLVFLMGVKNLSRIVDQLIEGGRPPETPVALIEQATSPYQKTVTGTLADIVARAHEIHPPALIVVGEVVRLRDHLHWYELQDRRPLMGWRILNTRPLPPAEARLPGDSGGGRRLFHTRAGCFDSFSQQLEALGAHVIELPATRIVALEDTAELDRALQHLADPGLGNGAARPDWLLFTSANAVRFFFTRLFSLGFDARALSGVQLAAVGETTGQALRGFYLAPDFIPSRSTGAGLADELPVQPGQRVLTPRSESALPDLIDGLVQRGIQVEAITTYKVEPAIPDPEVLAELIADPPDIATFFSPSAVQGLADMLAQSTGPVLRQALNGSLIACVGPTTQRAAEAAGLVVDLVAEPYTVEGMCDTLARAAQVRKRPNHKPAIAGDR